MPIVSLNSKKYSVSKIREYQLDPLGTAFRTQGSQRRVDNFKVNKYPFTQWTKGIGTKRMHRETGDNIDSLADATALTIHHFAMTNAILHEPQTHAAPLDHVVRYQDFKSDVWCLFESDYQTDHLQKSIQVAKFNGTTDTWDSPYAPTLNAVTSQEQESGTTLTNSHTTQSTYGNRLMLVVVMGESAATGVTEAGNALASITAINDGSNFVSIWWIAAPTTGTQNIVATVGSGETSMVVYDLYFCAQTSPTRAGDSNTGSGSSASCSPFSSYRDLIIGGMARTDTTMTTTSGTGQTEDYEASGVGNLAAIASHEFGTTGTTTTAHTYSWSGTKAYAVIAVAIKGIGVVGMNVNGTTEGIRAFDMVQHKAKMFVVGSDGDAELKYMVYATADGLSWDEAIGGFFPSGDLLTTGTTRTNQFDSDGARLCDFGNTLLVAVFDEANLEIEIYYTTDNGGSWTAGAVIPSGYGPKAFIVGPDPTQVGNVPNPLLFTAEGIYRVDSAGTTSDLLLAFDGSPQNGRWAVYGMDGAIWSPTDSGSYLHYEITPSGREVNFVQPRESLPDARGGFGNMFIAPTQPFIIVAHGGDATTGHRASLFAIDYAAYMDGEVGKTWPIHSMYYEATANVVMHAVKYSAEDDNTPRLHFSQVGAATDEMFHLEHPFTDPTSGVAMKFEAESYAEIAEDDISDPHTSSNLLSVRIDADNLSTTDAGEHVVYEYGIDGAAWNDNAEGEATFVGNFVSGDKLLDFGIVRQNETGQSETGMKTGISAKTLRSRLVLKRDAGDNSQFVAIKEFELEARSRVAVLKGWEFEIDLAGSVNTESTFTTTEEVITELNTVQSTVIKVPFKIGDSATYLVEMASGTWNLDVVSEDGGDDGEPLGQRSGKATIKVEEIVPL